MGPTSDSLTMAWLLSTFGPPPVAPFAVVVPPLPAEPPPPQPTITEASTEPSPRPMNFFLDNLPLLKIPLSLIS